MTKANKSENKMFENDGPRNGKNVKSAWQLKMVMIWNEILLPSICENDMHRNGNVGLKMGGLSRDTYLICNTYKVPPPPR